MKKIVKGIANAGKRLVCGAVDLYRRYPARGNSYILAAIVAGAGALHIVVDPNSAGAVIGWVVPILLGGEATHHLVSPAAKR